MKRLAVLREERGAATVFIVGAFLALLLIVGMSVDFGILLRYRRAMANACDAGVLAGGLNLRTSPETAATTAERYSTNDMTQNAISWTSFTATTYDANWNATLIAPDRIRAVIQTEVPTFFLRLALPSVGVSVSCAARITPIILGTGLVPIGLNYDAWSQYVNTNGCLDVIQDGVPLAERTPPCNSFDMTFAAGGGSGSSNPWGSGNTGLVAMGDGCYYCPPNAPAWEEAFRTGSQTQYCIDAAHTPAVGDVMINGQRCADLGTRPGTASGPVRQAVGGGNGQFSHGRCDSENPLDRIIMVPLLNPAYTDQGGGRYLLEIWGFSAYEIDCSNPPQPGNDLRISGGFVTIVTMQAYGTEAPVDTGVYTVRLIQD
jgi:putative Flp pilus-assembly TadE/G-like protein